MSDHKHEFNRIYSLITFMKDGPRQSEEKGEACSCGLRRPMMENGKPAPPAPTARFKEFSVIEIGLIAGGMALLEANVGIYNFRGEVLNVPSIEKLKYELLNELKSRPIKPEGAQG